MKARTADAGNDQQVVMGGLDAKLRQVAGLDMKDKEKPDRLMEALDTMTVQATKRKTICKGVGAVFHSEHFKSVQSRVRGKCYLNGHDKRQKTLFVVIALSQICVLYQSCSISSLTCYGKGSNMHHLQRCA